MIGIMCALSNGLTNIICNIHIPQLLFGIDQSYSSYLSFNWDNGRFVVGTMRGQGNHSITNRE